ncbi:MAG: hypothetical protein AAGC81_14990 [Pseudomonadota bacterium]
MAIRAWIAGLAGLMLAPVSAEALTVSATEFSGSPTGTITGVARDEVRGADVGALFDPLPGLPYFSSEVGTVILNFSDANFTVFATGTTSFENGVFTSTLEGFVLANGSDLPILQIFQSAPDFQTPSSRQTFSTTAEVTIATDGSGVSPPLTSLASFYGSTNHGGGDTDGDFNSGGQQLGDDLPILATAFANSGTANSGPVVFSTIADQDFALNNQLTFILEQGDLANFEIITVSEIPLPAPMLLLLSALAGVGAVGVRRRLS